MEEDEVLICELCGEKICPYCGMCIMTEPCGQPGHERVGSRKPPPTED